MNTIKHPPKYYSRNVIKYFSHPIKEISFCIYIYSFINLYQLVVTIRLSFLFVSSLMIGLINLTKNPLTISNNIRINLISLLLLEHYLVCIISKAWWALNYFRDPTKNTWKQNKYIRASVLVPMRYCFINFMILWQFVPSHSHQITQSCVLTEHCFHNWLWFALLKTAQIWLQKLIIGLQIRVPT